MSTQKNLTTLCAAAVFALGLAACSGGGDDGMPPLTLDGVKMGATVNAGTHTLADDLADAFENADPSAAMYLGKEFEEGATITVAGLDIKCSAGPCQVDVNDNGTITTTGTIMVAAAMAPPVPPVPPVANLTALFAAAQDASDAAAMAGKDAMAAETAATKAAMMLTTTETGGESKKAMTNAQTILDARDQAARAVKDAEMALADAEKAEMDAMEVAEGHPQKSALMKAVEAAVKAAEAQVKAAKMVRDGTRIRNAATEVTGGPQGKGTPRSVANSVGMDIAAALAVGAARGGTRIVYGAPAPAPAVAAAHKFETDNHQGMTWGMIVGEDNVRKERLGAANALRMVASVAGMTAADVDTDVDATGGVNGTNKYADAYTSDTSFYMGVPGDIFCLGMDCEVDANGKLKGSWYFSPTSETAYYQKMEDDPLTLVDESLTYEGEVLYASYGHWLTVSGTDWTVNTFANFAATNATDLTTVGTATNMLPNKATYSGMAAGMSVRKMGTGTSATTDSGRFTADVELTASFGAAPTVLGTIDNFVGDAAGAGWSVNLESVTLATTSTDGVATGSGRDGVWSATAYGTDAAKRPAGILGGFTAHFADGSAAGAFATRMDK